MRSHSARQTAVLVICSLALLQSGCGSVFIGRESAATCSVSGSGLKEGNVGSMEIEGVANNLRTFGLMGVIVPFIPFWSSGEDKAGRTVYLTFSPSGQEDFALDAQKIVLVNSQGESIPPSEIKGPYNRENLYDRTFPKATAGSFTISKKLAVHLLFPVDLPAPDHEFTVVLKGLSRSTEPIEAPTLKFKKQTSLGITYIPGFLCLHCGKFIDTKFVLAR